MKISEKIPLEKLPNTRDLGGMVTKDGKRVRYGKLIRSGALFSASVNDKTRLESYQLKKIIDFRSNNEHDTKPDPIIGNAQMIHIPIFNEAPSGIQQEETDRSMEDVISRICKDHSYGIKRMTTFYTEFIRNDYCISQYRRFVKEIAQTEQGGVLWHCAAGKDRAGFASVIVEEILGIPKKTIIEDYLATNKNLQANDRKILNYLGAIMDVRGSEEAILDFLGARTPYIEATYSAIEERFGSFDKFLKEGLLVDDELRDELKRRYLSKELF